MIFISYSWEDSVFARCLSTLLNKYGYQVWIDYQNLNLDEPLEPQIAQAIRLSDTVLLVDSVNARRSGWVQFELFLAQSSRRPLQYLRIQTN